MTNPQCCRADALARGDVGATHLCIIFGRATRHDTANDTHDDFIRSRHSTVQKVVICRVNETTSASVVGSGSGPRRRGSDAARKQDGLGHAHPMCDYART